MSLIRGTIWFIKGMREYTKGGYEAAAKAFQTEDLNVSVNGRRFVITGANSGIGKMLAMAVAQQGGEVHMVCRNQQRGVSAQEEIESAVENAAVHLHIVDLSQTKQVYEFTQRFTSQHDKIDVLVNNAGCMIHERRKDELGFETNFATNTLAAHILTTQLVPLLEKSDDPRVVTVSSAGMLNEKLKLTDLQNDNLRKFDATTVYAQQKRQQVVMMEQYSLSYPNIHFSTMHPGWADTPAVREAMPSFYETLKSRLRSPQQGADTALWLAISPAAKTQESGLFFQDRKPVSKHLPLSWTQSTAADDKKLMAMLDEMLVQVGNSCQQN